MALEGGFRFQSPVDGRWRDCTGAVIASNQPHAFDGRGASLLAHLFVEPESGTGRALRDRFEGLQGIATFEGPLRDAAARRLAEAWGTDRQTAPLVAAARDVLRLLTDGVETPTPADPRILRVLEHLRASLEEPVTLTQAAAVAHLSPGRFRHLFVQEVGVAFRTYLLWLRLNRALEAFAAGESMTTAAHLAGFADSAHLSRTFRRMYGLAGGSLRLD